MNPTAPNPHSGHDELLIARLFGGDVSEVERARALDQMAECDECEVLFADLGVVADATASLPTPVRPRDFTLTEADAARLGRPTRSRVPVFGLGLRRSLGGAVAALGIVGMVAAGTGSFVSQTATSLYASQPDQAGAAPQVGDVAVASTGESSKVVPVAAPTSAPVAVVTSAPSRSEPVPLTEPSIAPQMTGAGNPPVAPSASDAHEFAVATPGSGSNGTGSNVIGAGPAGATMAPATPAAPGSAPGSQGPDARSLLILGFGALSLVGVAIAVLPIRRGGRARGSGA
jgi:hypothetical protein